MKLKIFLFIILILAFFRIDNLLSENSRLKSNQDILLSEKESIMAESQKYKIADSLNAIKVSELQLTLKEYKKYRAQDLQLIEQLNIKKYNLQKVINTQSETINTLSINIQDSIIADTVTNQIDTLKCFKYKSKWTDVSGCLDLRRDTVDIQINNRESLKVVETVIHRRFLGFLWKTKRIKSRHVDIVSENPNTKITNCEYISVKR